MKIEAYYDVSCLHCGRYRSTDFDKGMPTSKDYLRKAAKAEGWKTDKTTKMPVCPICASAAAKTKMK